MHCEICREELDPGEEPKECSDCERLFGPCCESDSDEDQCDQCLPDRDEEDEEDDADDADADDDADDDEEDEDL